MRRWMRRSLNATGFCPGWRGTMPKTTAEGRRNRTARAYLAALEAAVSGSMPAADLAATVSRLEASNAELRGIIRRLQIDKRNLATENLLLLHRARLAEDRLRARDRELAGLQRLPIHARASANVTPKQARGGREVSAPRA